MKPIVFVSHIHENSDIAKRVKEWLEERLLGAVDVFVSSDGSSIRGGERWMEAVETSLRASKLVLVLCSPSSAERRWVFFEAGGAFFLGARVIPICIDGLTRDKLSSPLNFFQAFELTEPDHLKLLLGEIASHVGLRAPSSDLSDAHWLTSGERIPSKLVSQVSPKAAYNPLTLKEVNDRILAQTPPIDQSAVEHALLMFEYMYDTSYFRGEDSLSKLEDAPGWVKHFVTKLNNAGLPLPTGPVGEGGKRRANSAELSAHLQSIAQQYGWTKADALMDLESLLPDAIPLVAKDLLLIYDLEDFSSLGWRIQLDLIGRLAFHGDVLVVRLIGTLARREGFRTMNSLTDGLIKAARQILGDDDEFERWFFDFSRTKYDQWLARQEEENRAYEERWRRRERDG